MLPHTSKVRLFSINLLFASQFINTSRSPLSYFSDTENRLVTRYCGSVFIGHCTAKDLISHVSAFMEKMNIDKTFY